MGFRRYTQVSNFQFDENRRLSFAKFLKKESRDSISLDGSRLDYMMNHKNSNASASVILMGEYFKTENNILDDPSLIKTNEIKRLVEYDETPGPLHPNTTSTGLDHSETPSNANENEFYLEIENCLISKVKRQSSKRINTDSSNDKREIININNNKDINQSLISQFKNIEVEIENELVADEKNNCCVRPRKNTVISRSSSKLQKLFSLNNEFTKNKKENVYNNKNNNNIYNKACNSKSISDYEKIIPVKDKIYRIPQNSKSQNAIERHMVDNQEALIIKNFNSSDGACNKMKFYQNIPQTDVNKKINFESNNESKILLKNETESFINPAFKYVNSSSDYKELKDKINNEKKRSNIGLGLEENKKNEYFPINNINLSYDGNDNIKKNFTKENALYEKLPPADNLQNSQLQMINDNDFNINSSLQNNFKLKKLKTINEDLESNCESINISEKAKKIRDFNKNVHTEHGQYKCISSKNLRNVSGYKQLYPPLQLFLNDHIDKLPIKRSKSHECSIILKDLHLRNSHLSQLNRVSTIEQCIKYSKI